MLKVSDRDCLRFGLLTLFFFAFAISAATRTSVAAPREDILGVLESKGLILEKDEGPEVTCLQKALTELGYLNSRVDGIFGPLTRSALIRYQKDKSLKGDGVAGPLTKSAMLTDYLKINPPDVHVVRHGETLSLIGHTYGVDVKGLQSLNGIKNLDYIYPGQVLKLKPVSVKETPVAPQTQNLEPREVFFEPLKSVCLTFDDGPDPLSTRQILDTLDDYGVSATFFLVGQKVLQYPEIALEIAQKGHVCAVHGFTHRRLGGLSDTEIAKDLKGAKEAILNVTGFSPWLYRPPGGVLDMVQVKEASRLGLRVLMWTNVGSADLGAKSPEEVVERILGGVSDGGTLLLHEGLPNTAEALPDVIEALARMGYGFQNPAPPKS